MAGRRTVDNRVEREGMQAYGGRSCEFSVQAKLIGGFATVLLLASVAILGITRLDSAARSAEKLYTQNLLGLQFALSTDLKLAESARDELKAFLETGPTQRAGFIKASHDQMGEARQALRDYHQTFASAEDEKRWAKVEELVGGMITEREKALTLLAQNRDAEAAKVDAAAVTAVIAANGRSMKPQTSKSS